jgi:hypothetical protein
MTNIIGETVLHLQPVTARRGVHLVPFEEITLRACLRNGI